MPDKEKNKLIEKLKNHCYEGLQTDGEHHKQWHLEQILNELLRLEPETINNVETARGYMEWEEGIAP